MRLHGRLQTESEVHPRIRGEDRGRGRGCLRDQGSPPHTRGRWEFCQKRFSFTRFTPAYAGKISGCRCPPCRARVHPRIRGEDRHKEGRRMKFRGSPPHTRGRSRGTGRPPPPQGFTPAYAGKIGYMWEWQGLMEVHPRIRGEDSWTGAPDVTSRGSPPHTRGRWVTNHAR